MKKLAVVLFSLLLSLSQAPNVRANECVTDGDHVELVGTISEETFPGPPNYQSIDDGDAAETYWFLTTDDPVCVYGVNFETGKFYRLGKLATFQLVLHGSQYKKKGCLVNLGAYVQGTIATGFSGHHHTKALIDVSDLRPAFATDWDIVAEVYALDEIDRKAVVMMVRGYIKVNLKRTLDIALKSGGDDRSWALKTVAIADAWMIKLTCALGWEKMGDYYETEAMNLTKYIRGETSWNEYLSASRRNQHALSVVIKHYMNDGVFISRMKYHHPLADRIGKYLVGSSKLGASE